MGRDRVRISEQEFKTSAAQDSTTSEESLQTESPTLNARQNAVLKMQQTQGNAAVRRAIAQRSYGAEGGPIDDETTAAINSSRGGGQSLDSGVAQRMSESMGADFSGVKVHTDDKSSQLNQTLNARAFTTGQDIFFQKGEYNPGSSSGQQLLAHELTHVVQQGGSSASGPLTLGPAGDSYESEADSVSDSVTSGQGLQRQTDDETA